MQEASEIRASGLFLPPVIPEGGFLTRAACTLERRADLGVWAIRLQDRVNGAPNRLITLLPSQALSDMIDAARAADRVGETTIFEVTGRILAWHGSNFLLVSFAVPVTSIEAPRTGAAPLLPPGAMPPNAPTAAAAAPSAAAGAAPAAATPAADPAAPPSATQVDPENVGSQLERALDSRVTTVAKSPDAQPAAALAEPGSVQPSRAARSAGSELAGAIREPSASEPLGPDGRPLPQSAQGMDQRAAGEPASQDAVTDGATTEVGAIGDVMPSASASSRVLRPQRLLDRRGIVTRDPMTGTWIFVLASGGVHEGDHAMELLPCEALDRLIAMTRSAPQTVSVVLTGEVTLFEGRNYLRPVRMRALREGRWIGP